MTSISTASKCPKCNNQGELVQSTPARRGMYESRIYKCTTKLCRWFDSNWLVQIDEDGNVPERDIGHVAKSFPNLPELSPEQLKRIREPKFDDDISLHQPGR